MRAFLTLIIMFSVLSTMLNTRCTSALAAKPPQARVKIAVDANLADFIKKLAFEEEKEEERDWYRLRGAFYGEYGHSPLSFEEVLGVLDTRYLAKITDTRNYTAKLEKYDDLSFPVIWKLLDRKKPVRVYNLFPLLFFHTGPDPENEEHAKKLRMILGLDQENTRNKEKERRKDTKYLPHDTLMYVKLSLLDWLEKSLEEDPDSWSEKPRKKAVKRLRGMYDANADSAEQWYLKERTRRALLTFSDKSDIAEGMKTPVWETTEFQRWLEKAEKDNKLSSFD